MSQTDQTGKNPAKKLGRGLSALLGTPVSIRVPKEGERHTGSRTEALSPMSTSSSMQETLTASAAAAEPDPSLTALVRGALSGAPRVAKQPPVVDPSPSETGFEVREIPVEQIVPNPRQPRTDFDQASIESLAASIRQAGLMQPIMVRRARTGFELVAGERRWRAAKLIGLRVIPAIIRDLSDESSAELALIENVHREDLNPMDRALALRRLAVDFELTHQDVADRVGLDRASVTNLLRLAELDPATAELVRRGAISQSHGKALLAVANLDRRLELAKRSAAAGWSVRELERRVQQVNGVKPSITSTSSQEGGDPTPRSANVADLERKLAEHLGTRVSLQLGRKKGSGRLIVEFYSFDQFDGLMARLGFNADR
ncbi:MAG: hypothetical protein RLY21_32 [Planctomycetota bacterium]|jgi:ParB family chromosome partitioning protein